MVEPWVAPDAPAEEAPPTAATAPVMDPVPRAGSGAPTAGRVRPAVPVPLRPMTVADILDGALRVLKLAPRTTVTLAAVFVVPVQIVVGLLTQARVGDAGVAGPFGDVLAGGEAAAEVGVDALVLSFVLQGLVLALVCVGTAELVSAWYIGEDRTVADLLRAVRRRALAAVAAWVLVHAAEAVFALALVVPAVVPFTWYAIVTPVIACEGRNPWKALGRSYALTNRRFGAVLGTALLVAGVTALLTVGLGAVGEVYAATNLPLAWVVQTAIAAGCLLVTVPFAAGAATLLYLDLRVRTEGLDIELAAARRFRDAAP